MWMFAFIVFDLFFSVLAGKNVSEMTYFVLGGTLNLNSINQLIPVLECQHQ